MARKKVYQKRPFESNQATSDTSANIYMSMLRSDAWKHLTKSQQVLYLVCKSQLYAEKHKPLGEESFTMNRAKWCKLFELYTDSNHQGFYRDMAALIEHGLVICVERGQNTRTKNVYAFSSMWRHYGTPQFYVDPRHMTQRMLNNARKKKD